MYLHRYNHNVSVAARHIFLYDADCLIFRCNVIFFLYLLAMIIILMVIEIN